MDLRSLEGMFYRGPNPKIILPSLNHRPRGRVAFSCAHEIGHFDLGHGTQVDEYVGDEDRSAGFSNEELAADAFASTLLAPRPAVLARFSCRGWNLDNISAVDLYRVATELDLGYGTLCKHLCFGLGLVGDHWMKVHANVPPKSLRYKIAPLSECIRIVVLDQNWPDVAVDLEVGDCLAVPKVLRIELPTSLRLEEDHEGRQILRATTPGEETTIVGDRPVRVRIARTGYRGLLKYRYLEEGEDA